MELKTLKDIDILNADLEEYNRIGPTPFFHKKLRAEAIKWISILNDKSPRKVSEISVEEISISIYKTVLSDKEIYILTNWIIGFFNITEDDLKCM